MKKCCLFIALVFIAIFPSSIIWGDVVVLDNSSKIIGKIEKVVGGEILIKTDFAGTLNIKIERVISLSSDTPLLVSFPNGNRLYGNIEYKKDKTLINTPDGRLIVEQGGFLAAWLKDASDPLAPERRKWSYEAGFDIAGKTGNSKRVSTGGRVKAKLQGPKDQLLFYLRGSYAKEDGDKTDDEIIGGIDFESRFDEKHSWYARIELENDDMEELDLRTTAALGYGYYFFDKANHVLRGRAGFMYRHESYSIVDSESTAGLDFGLYHMYKFDEWCKVVTKITYTPSLEDFGDYRAFHESAFEIPLAKSDSWKLQLGFANEYNSNPVPGNERMDTTYFSRIVFKYE